MKKDKEGGNTMKYLFSPKKDITAYELAKLIKYLIPHNHPYGSLASRLHSNTFVQEVDKLSQHIKRHIE